MKIYEIITESTYLGSCADSFDDETGDCDAGFFNDVSDFAWHDENATKISKNEFHSIIQLSNHFIDLENKYEVSYLSYDNGILALYIEPVWDENNDKDPETDMHYFFATN